MIRKGWVWIVVAVFAVALGAALALWRPAAAPVASQGPGPGGAFQLTNQYGQPVDQSILQHKWSAVFFGYTFCPDVCPTTLQALGAASRELGPAAKNFQVLFISVDPARDTPAVLKTYLSNTVFPKGTIGLTGSDQQVANVAKVYGVYYQRDGSGPNYGVDHSSAIYLMNPDGRFDTVLAFGMTPDEMREQILKAMGKA